MSQKKIHHLPRAVPAPHLRLDQDATDKKKKKRGVHESARFQSNSFQMVFNHLQLTNLILDDSHVGFSSV